MNTIPPCLDALTAHQRDYVNDQLSNNDVSEDAQIVALWIQAAGLTPEQAEAAIGFRPQALMDPFFELFPTTDIPHPRTPRHD